MFRVTIIDWWMQQQRQAERPGAPDEILIRSYTNNMGEQRFLVEGRRLGLHLGDKAFPNRDDALAYAKMIAGWHGAKLIDRTAR